MRNFVFEKKRLFAQCVSTVFSFDDCVGDLLV